MLFMLICALFLREERPQVRHICRELRKQHTLHFVPKHAAPEMTQLDANMSYQPA